jgi:hypothetical protein
VTTHERELSHPVDLATRDGGRLADRAKGWSRVPLHRANLRGGWGRTKRWDYWAILAGDFVIACVLADVDYIGLADVWWCDLALDREGGAGTVSPGSMGIHLPDVPGSVPIGVHRRRIHLDIADSPAGRTRITASWSEFDGSPGRLDATVDLPAGHESLNVVIPWSETRFQYTSKHQARPAHGTVEAGGRTVRLDDVEGGAWGVLDVGRGRWPYRTRWNWGGGAGRAGPDGPVVGLQVGGMWTAGTGFTENGFLVDGRLTKIGRELRWEYSWEEPMRPWVVGDPDGQLEARLEPLHDRHSRTELGLAGTEVHQVFGHWSGHVVTDDGVRTDFERIQGFAEESRSRW